MTASDAARYSARMGRVYLLALDEILGVEEARRLLNSAGRLDPADLPFPVIHKIHRLLAEQYGPKAGRGVAQRLGRAAFKYLLGSFGSELGLDALEFRLLPLRRRIDFGLDLLIQLFKQETGQINRLESEPESYRWQIENCPFCMPSQPLPGPACDWMVGLMQEAMSWMGGGNITRFGKKNVLRPATAYVQLKSISYRLVELC